MTEATAKHITKTGLRVALEDAGVSRDGDRFGQVERLWASLSATDEQPGPSLAQQAFNALRDAEDRLVNTLPQVSKGNMDLWNEARDLVDSSPDWTTYRLTREDEAGVFRALIYQFKAIASVRAALKSLYDSGLIHDSVAEGLISIGSTVRERSQRDEVAT